MDFIGCSPAHGHLSLLNEPDSTNDSQEDTFCRWRGLAGASLAPVAWRGTSELQWKGRTAMWWHIFASVGAWSSAAKQRPGLGAPVSLQLRDVPAHHRMRARRQSRSSPAGRVRLRPARMACADAVHRTNSWRAGSPPEGSRLLRRSTTACLGPQRTAPQAAQPLATVAPISALVMALPLKFQPPSTAWTTFT